MYTQLITEAAVGNPNINGNINGNIDEGALSKMVHLMVIKGEGMMTHLSPFELLA